MGKTDKVPASTGGCSLDSLVGALTEIRKMAMEHPAFYKEAFDSRDIDALCDEGGDVCDWTMIAILADDALRPNDTLQGSPEAQRKEIP